MLAQSVSGNRLSYIMNIENFIGCVGIFINIVLLFCMQSVKFDLFLIKFKELFLHLQRRIQTNREILQL